MSEAVSLSSTIGNFLLTYGFRAIWVLILMVGGWMGAGWVGALVRANLTRARIDETLTKFLARLVRWAIIVLVAISCLGYFGIETTSFAALIAALGLAIGLGFQGSLANFAAGVMLLVFRPFEVGAWITTAGRTGTVAEIGLFFTTIDTGDNTRIILPNSSVSGSVIENTSFHETRRAEVSVGVDYAADIDRTREALTQAAEGTPGRLEDREPQVLLTGLGASSVDWVVRVWSKSGDYGATKQALIRATKLGLDDAGISIPFPQMDVHVDRESAA